MSRLPATTPAYARDLIERRQRGYAPWHVHLFVGREPWHFRDRAEFDPCLIATESHALTRLNLSAAAGSALHLFLLEAEDWSEVYSALMARAALHCAPVLVTAPHLMFNEEDASHIAFAEREVAGGLFQWVSSWSDVLEESYQARRRAWLDAWEGAACPMTATR